MYYRELHRAQTNLKSPFWLFTTDAHLLQATNYWCMVFGAQGSNPTHWKHLAIRKEDQKELREGFKQAVLGATAFTEAEWQEYWAAMVEFRNKYVVHRENFTKPVPDFDKALKVAYAYDGWIREIFGGHWSEPRLKLSTEDIKKTVQSFLEDVIGVRR